MDNKQALPGIGMRNLKTALAVLICILVLRMFGNTSPFYACIAAVITMQRQVESSYKMGLERMIGTMLGAIIGMVFAMIAPHNPWLIAIGIVLVIFTTNLLRQTKSTTIACIVFLAIMTTLDKTTPLHYSVLRVLETFLGIIAAVGVNVLVFPPREAGTDTIREEGCRD